METKLFELNKDGKTILKANKSITDVVIPDDVTDIAICAFHSCVDLKSITIPSHVTRIGSYAFDNCISLKSITMHGVKYNTVMGDDGKLCVYDKSYNHTITHKVISKIKVYTGVKWFNGVEYGEVSLSDEMVMVCDESRSLYAHADTLKQAIKDLIRKYDALKQEASSLDVLTPDTIITNRLYVNYTGGINNSKALYTDKYKKRYKTQTLHVRTLNQ